MKLYLGDVSKEEIIGLEDYDLSEEEIEEIKEGRLGFIDILDDEDIEEDEDYYYYLFELIKNESTKFKPRPAQTKILVAASDFECDAASSLAAGNDFDDYNHGYLFNEPEEGEDETIVFRCGNNLDGKELVYKYIL